jgi:starch phosphorylase
LTIGTLDGANVEIMEAVGSENIFIFGLSSEEVADKRRKGYDPNHHYRNDQELKRAIDMIAAGHFSPQQPGLFAPIVHSLREQGDFYMLLADYRPYVTAQDAVDRLFADQEQWTRRSILNTARMGYFSSDRSVMDYAREIWHIQPLA